MNTRLILLDEFYEVLEELSLRCGGTRTLGESDGRMSWPSRGVYFFFEHGEYRADGVRPRVVRVGTHALRPSRSSLWGRLSQHRGTNSGALAGGGSHRGSIFRLHVGKALLATGGYSPPIAATWGHGSTPSREIRHLEYPLERDVSLYIRAMPFLWLEVDDPPSAASDRGLIERKSIALLSNYEEPACDPPSWSWLGRQSTRTAIRESGLWNVNHVREPTPGPELLALMRRHLE